MIDLEKLEQLKQAAARADWNRAGELYVDLSLAARSASTRLRIESLAWAVRLRDHAALVVLAEKLTKGP
jgi:hypothetical protein